MALIALLTIAGADSLRFIATYNGFLKGQHGLH